MSKSKLSGELQFFICLLIMMIILFPIGNLLSKSIRQEEHNIETNGIIGVCTVTRVSASNRFSDGGKRLIIRYEYEVDGKLYTSNSFYNNFDYLYNVFIGMKYEVKYLKENPQKSILLVDKPITSEYKNIEKERERMQLSGKYKKTLQDTISIEVIKMRYPEYFK